MGHRLEINGQAYEAEDDDTVRDVLEDAPTADKDDLATVNRDGDPVILDADMDITDLDEDTKVGTLSNGNRLFGYR